MQQLVLQARPFSFHSGDYMLILKVCSAVESPHTITMTSMTFWMNGSFNEPVLQEISGACVETNPRSIIATPHKFAFLVQAAKTLAVASERGYSTFVCACLQTQSTM